MVRRGSLVVVLVAICLLLLPTACVSLEGEVEESPVVQDTATPTGEVRTPTAAPAASPTP